MLFGLSLKSSTICPIKKTCRDGECRFLEEIITGGIGKEVNLKIRGQDPLNLSQLFNKSDTKIAHRKVKN